MGIHMNGIPIEVLVQSAYEKVADSATKDLRGAVDRIESNNDMKSKLRNMQKKLALFKQKVKSGDKHGAKQAYLDLRQAANAAGYGANSDVGEALLYKNAPGYEWEGDVWFPKVTNQSDDMKTKWDDYFKGIETIIDAESQSYSDIGQQLQFELTQANNVYNRTTKAQSDLQAKWDRTMGGIIGNIKG